jgi:hypothetical protein
MKWDISVVRTIQGHYWNNLLSLKEKMIRGKFGATGNGALGAGGDRRVILKAAG